MLLIEKKPEYANAARRLFHRVTEDLDMHTVTEVRILRCLIFDGMEEDQPLFSPPVFLYDELTEHLTDEDEIRAAAQDPETACICVIPLFRRPAEQMTEKALQMVFSSPSPAASASQSGGAKKETEGHFSDAEIHSSPVSFRQVDVFVIRGLDQGEKNSEQRRQLKQLLINPVSSVEFPLFTTGTLPPLPTDTEKSLLSIHGFREMDDDALLQLAKEERYRMSQDDLRFIRSYFRVEEKRDPNRFELRMIDTYWSDHCRHITFLTALQDLQICDHEISESFERYLETREALYGTRPKNITLMDIATVPAKYLVREGKLPHYMETGENNAFTIRADVKTDEGVDAWLLHFKNETHNYSTVRDPYLGAFSSFGSTISDTLSARAEVFAAMRLSGQGIPDVGMKKSGFHTGAGTYSAREKRRNGAEMQDRQTSDSGAQLRKMIEAADGFAAFGVQSGIPCGYVYEWLHPGFAAKHMEVCFAAAAAPQADCYTKPIPGDIIVLVGAKTGRDGLGGGLHASVNRIRRSAYENDAAFLEAMADESGSEDPEKKRNTYTSQIGDPQVSRALVRMMRRADVRKLVKRASDIGSGGLAVAAAELASGVRIDLDRVPTSISDRIAVGCLMSPYEIAFSETQARMLLVLPSISVSALADIASEEDLDTTVIGIVTSERRCRLLWWERTLLSLSRDFLDATGAERRVSAYIPPADVESLYFGISDHLMGEDITELYLRLMMHPEVAARSRILSERFDATAGGRTVMMPFGGKRMMTPTDYMAFRFPTETVCEMPCKTHTCAVFSCGYLPRYAEQSPYHGAYLAVLCAICRLAAAGIQRKDIALSLQEYFPMTGDDPVRFGVPLAAMLGAFQAQMDYEVAAVGGKDSMNGTDESGELDVPPTVIAFGAATTEQENLYTAEFKKAGSRVYLLSPVYGENRLPDPAEEKNLLSYLYTLQRDKKILSCMAVSDGGIAAAVAQMCFGNQIGFNYESTAGIRRLLEDRPGAFLVETDEVLRGILLGYTKDTANILIGSTTLPLSLLESAWCKPQEKWYADLSDMTEPGIVASFPNPKHSIDFPAVSIPSPKVLLPVLPYLSGEDVLASRFAAAGIEPVKLLFACRNKEETAHSMKRLADALLRQDIGILAFAGGSYPGYGSVPSAINDPAALFAKVVFSDPMVFEALLTFCDRESHLILGLGEGFRMLLTSGVFYGDGMTPLDERISLVENPCGHLVSKMVRVRTMSVSSPWMRYCESGDIYTLPVASKAGRCVIPGELVLDMGKRGMIASQYVDADGNPTLDTRWNPFVSDFAVEGVFARDGRIFGRMAHCDRIDRSLCINIPGNKEQDIFRAAADYFKIT
ncbi:MAG: phosphoribosylformylglycinamidine synthase subunit PurQ [Clostridia bacterium]|nr:phosphoribosylformylglycinamidine synthase subunit PurQ [Clostridia bacterium]